MEESEFQRKYKESLLREEKEELENHSTLIESFIKYAADHGVILGPGNFNFFCTSGIIASYPNLLQQLFPEIQKDKEGLYDFASLTRLFSRKFFANGYLYSDQCALMANTFFRRSFHPINNWYPRFIEYFWSLDDKDIELSVSLDPDRVKVNIDDHGYGELDTWYGAKFNKDILTIPDGNVKVRPPLDMDDSTIYFFFASVYSLDINWETKNGIKSFEAEEFKAPDVIVARGEKQYHPVRYVHAEFDMKSGYFRHFDGAVHLYTEDEYAARLDSDLNHNWKNNVHIKTLSEKLFKMNGKISVDTWIEFTSQFFTGNPLVFEYFEGKYPPHIVEVLEKKRATPDDSLLQE